MIILIIGSGGAFKQMLIDSGVSDVLAQLISKTQFPPIILAFIIARQSVSSWDPPQSR